MTLSSSSNLGTHIDVVIDAAPCALVVLERDGSISLANPAARLLLRTGRVLRSAAELFALHPETFVRLQQGLLTAHRQSVVTSLLRADGTPVDVQVEAEPVFDDAQEYLGAVCSLRDVTAERAAARELLERQRLMESLSHAVRDISADLALDSVLDRVCERAASLVGAAGSGLVIIEGADAVCVAEWQTGPAHIGARWPATEGLIGQARRTGEAAQVGDIHAFSPTAIAMPVMARLNTVICVPAIHNGQTIGGLYVLFEQEDLRLSQNELDVLELLAAHAGAAINNASAYAEVVRSRARQQALVDATADGMALVDAEGRIESWNTAAASLTGITASEAIGSPPPFPLDLDQTSSDHQLVTGRWLEIISSPVAGTGEHVIDFRDVTQAKRLEAARDLFLATSSHEMRTPITVIKGFAGTLLHRWDMLSDAERRASVSTIVQRTESLASLVDQLLLGSTTEAGFTVEAIAFDLGDALRAALAGFETLSPRHTLVLRVPPGLPPVTGDRGSLDNVVAQLIENAIKYSPDGGEVRVTASHEGAALVVRVSDEGIGIDDDDTELIFERFLQAGSGDRRQFGGLGLGLYIVRRLIEAQGGSVRAYSGPGRGATFEFTLPVTDS